MRAWIAAGVAFGSVMVAQPGHAAQMSGPDIRDAITGKRIYLQVPMGGEFPLFYKPNGQVDGTGTARGLGVLTRVSDTGRWWVAGDRLCQVWNTHENGRQFCFTLQRVSRDRLRWVRNDGLAGDARIGD